MEEISTKAGGLGSLFVSGEGLEVFKDIHVDPAVASDDIFSEEEVRSIFKVAHHASRFFYDEGAGGHVVGLEADFPKSVIAAGGHVGEI